MALITCPDCQKEISESAVSCPFCGRPLRPTVARHTGYATWQKYTIGCFLVLFVLFLIGLFGTT